MFAYGYAIKVCVYAFKVVFRLIIPKYINTTHIYTLRRDFNPNTYT